MSNHEALRSAVALRTPVLGNDGDVVMAQLTFVSVSQVGLAELLAEFDALRAVPGKPAKGGYTPEFESAWADYPARPGNSKAAAFKAWQARVKAGASAEEMLSGTLKYAAYCKAMKTEPAYVKQAATFYGPGEHFSADWTVPRQEVRRALPDRRQDMLDAANAEAIRLLRGGPADDGRTIDG